MSIPFQTSPLKAPSINAVIEEATTAVSDMAESTINDFYLSITDLADMVGKEPKAVYQEINATFGPQRMKSMVLPNIARRYLSQHQMSIPQKVISFQMLKGGVAKTTSALNFGIRAAMFGARVLFIDLDQQANLTFALGVDAETRPVWVDIFEKKATIQDSIVSIQDGVDLVPSNLNNSVLDRVLLNGNRNWAQAVKLPLKEVRAHYDLVVIDTAPHLSAINTAVTCASDVVVLPINPDKFSVLGLKKHSEDLKQIQAEFDIKVEQKVLFTKYDGRESASREILNWCMNELGEDLLKNYIRTSSDIKNTIGSAKTIYTSKGAAKEDYDLVTREILGFAE